YIALGTFISAAAALGVDATPMEGFDPAQYDAILGLSDKGYRAVAVAAAGYRSPDDKYGHLPKVRFPRAEVVRHIYETRDRRFLGGKPGNRSGGTLGAGHTPPTPDGSPGRNSRWARG